MFVSHSESNRTLDSTSRKPGMPLHVIVLGYGRARDFVVAELLAARCLIAGLVPARLLAGKGATGHGMLASWLLLLLDRRNGDSGA